MADVSENAPGEGLPQGNFTAIDTSAVSGSGDFGAEKQPKKTRKSGGGGKKKHRSSKSKCNSETYDADFESEDEEPAGISGDNASNATNNAGEPVPEHVKEWLSTSGHQQHPNESGDEAAAPGGGGDKKKTKRSKRKSGDAGGDGGGFNTTIKGFNKALKGQEGGLDVDEGSSLPQLSPSNGPLNSPPLSARNNGYASDSATVSLPQLSARSNRTADASPRHVNASDPDMKAPASHNGTLTSGNGSFATSSERLPNLPVRSRGNQGYEKVDLSAGDMREMGGTSSKPGSSRKRGNSKHRASNDFEGL